MESRRRLVDSWGGKRIHHAPILYKAKTSQEPGTTVTDARAIRNMVLPLSRRTRHRIILRDECKGDDTRSSRRLSTSPGDSRSLTYRSLGLVDSSSLSESPKFLTSSFFEAFYLALQLSSTQLYCEDLILHETDKYTITSKVQELKHSC